MNLYICLAFISYTVLGWGGIGVGVGAYLFEFTKSYICLYFLSLADIIIAVR